MATNSKSAVGVFNCTNVFPVFEYAVDGTMVEARAGMCLHPLG